MRASSSLIFTPLVVFERVQAALKRIVPSVERIRIRRAAAPTPLAVSERIHFDLHGASDLPASVVSEGTLVTVAFPVTA